MREGGRKAEAGPPFQEEPTPLTPDLTSTCWGAPPPGVFLTETSPQGSRPWLSLLPSDYRHYGLLGPLAFSPSEGHSQLPAKFLTLPQIRMPTICQNRFP